MTDSNIGAVIRAYIERVERINETIQKFNEEKRDVFKEARGNGLDPIAIKEIVRLRAQDPDKRAEREAIIETYLRSLGGL